MGESPLASSVAVPRLSLWQRLKAYGLKKLLLVCSALGIGFGIGVVGAAVSVAWLESRPIAATEWKRLDIPSLSLKASLKTDYDDGVRYQFKVTPRSQDLIPAFDNAVQSHRDTISFTLHLYDKAGFELCKTDVRPSPVVDADEHATAMEANESFSGCSRSEYQNVERWNLSYVFPSFASGTDANGSGQKAPVSPHKAQQKSAPVASDEAGDDTLTGFDLYSGHLETLSGKTFLIYREGEKSTAEMWAIDQDVTGKGQAHIQFKCKDVNDCLIENPEKHQTVHGKLLK